MWHLCLYTASLSISISSCATLSCRRIVSNKAVASQVLFASTSTRGSTNDDPHPHAHPSNHLWSVDTLRNDYFALRHGQSRANVAKIIMSDPIPACHEYGLSETGQQQARHAAQHEVIPRYRSSGSKSNDQDGAPTSSYTGLVILSSDLLRAYETATIVADHARTEGIPVYQDQVIVETRLRERWFGDWDGSSDQNYHKVWQEDARDASHTLHGVESVNQVMQRTTQCILEWDERLSLATLSSASHHERVPSRFMVILVAHGDVLQITQTAFAKMDGRLHRQVPHLETAQLRRLDLATRSAYHHS